MRSLPMWQASPAEVRQAQMLDELRGLLRATSHHCSWALIRTVTPNPRYL